MLRKKYYIYFQESINYRDTGQSGIHIKNNKDSSSKVCNNEFKAQLNKVFCRIKEGDRKGPKSKSKVSNRMMKGYMRKARWVQSFKLIYISILYFR